MLFFSLITLRKDGPFLAVTSEDTETLHTTRDYSSIRTGSKFINVYDRDNNGSH